MKEEEENKIYLEKDTIWSAVNDYYETDVISDDLGNIITMLAAKIMSSKSFSGYPYIEEMKSQAIYVMMKALHHKKCKLWTQQKERSLVETILEKFKLPDNVDLTGDDIPVVSKINEARGMVKFQVYAKCDGLKFEDGTAVYAPKLTITDNGKELCRTHTMVYDEDHQTKVFRFEELEKEFRGQKYVYKMVCDDEGEPSIVKTNLFGYFTAISKHEAMGMIKKENRQVEALDKYGTETFTNFLADNPDMAPQRIDNDTYDDFLED